MGPKQISDILRKNIVVRLAYNLTSGEMEQAFALTVNQDVSTVRILDVDDR